MNVVLNKNDEIVMRLLHYFITEQGYNPIVLHGAKDEIWLEKTDADYQIVRIVSNYIHNNEQLNFDLYRTKQITKKIKRKMMSFKINTLSLFVNLGDAVKLKDVNIKDIDCANIKKVNDLKKYDFIINTFPNILEVETYKEKGLDLFVKLTEDINKKSIEENKKAEAVFSKKTPIITYSIMLINVLVFILCSLVDGNIMNLDANMLYKYGGLVSFTNMSSYSELYRLITSAFMHASIIHLLCNMYSLYILGPQLESFFGKTKFLIIYLFSAISGGLMSMLFLQDNVVTVGASGAIFGLFGCLLYFGYHYRIYLGTVMKSQIIPLIILNLIISFSLPMIDAASHIGGLIGGLLISMAVGVKYHSDTSDRVNGIIMTIIFTGFLLYMSIFRV